VSSAALRPGIAQGVYPERAESREGRLERWLHEWRGAAARRGLATRGQLEGFVRSVERRGRELRSEPESLLVERARALHQPLVVDGLTDDLLARVFAVVRELAKRTLGTPHYDVQLMGGWVMSRGMLAEMDTGEGKTLTATLPACAAALAGIPVHVVSANDYLVERDAAAMRPLYDALGLTVGAVVEREKDPALRRAAYRCAITYGTAKQIAFDYLRDGLQRGPHQQRLAMQLEWLHREQPRSDGLLLRGLCFAVVDEADSVLIDEARTPLILSRPSGSSEQRRTYRRALRLAKALEEGRDFRMHPREGRLELTDAGCSRLEELTRPLEGFWSGPRRREEWVARALTALHLFTRDRHYLVREGKVQIIDGPTGRVSPDRSWEAGLHQLIELKEGCELTPELETVARISYQQFFRRYLRLAGATGTAREVAHELWSVYRLNSVPIPTRRPRQRRDRGLRVLRTRAAKSDAVLESIARAHRNGRPVLVGTGSVAESDELAGELTSRGLAHRVLNARQDAEEAEIVAEAGEPGRITVATNMAGRGTDIRLAVGIAELGGLHVIATQRAEARRIDRQLFGRCGRQGDPGSYEVVASLEDEELTRFYPAGLLSWLRRGDLHAPIPERLGRLLTSLPQLAEERRHSRMRRRLVELEEYLGDLLAFSGPRE
jgi:preprotein translocase subunit SecA